MFRLLQTPSNPNAINVHVIATFESGDVAKVATEAIRKEWPLIKFTLLSPNGVVL